MPMNYYQGADEPKMESVQMETREALAKLGYTVDFFELSGENQNPGSLAKWEGNLEFLIKNRLLPTGAFRITNEGQMLLTPEAAQVLQKSFVCRRDSETPFSTGDVAGSNLKRRAEFKQYLQE